MASEEAIRARWVAVVTRRMKEAEAALIAAGIFNRASEIHATRAANLYRALNIWGDARTQEKPNG